MSAPSRQHLLEAYDLVTFAIVKMTDARNTHTDPALIDRAERTIQMLTADAECIRISIKALELQEAVARIGEDIRGLKS